MTVGLSLIKSVIPNSETVSITASIRLIQRGKALCILGPNFRVKRADWLRGPTSFFFFLQWTSARVNANQGRCINGHLSHCMRWGLNVMLNCLSCALGWSLHYMALGGLLQDLGDSSDSWCEWWKQCWGVYWSGIQGDETEGVILNHSFFFIVTYTYYLFLLCCLMLCLWERFLKFLLTFCTQIWLYLFISLIIHLCSYSCSVLFPLLWLATLMSSGAITCVFELSHQHWCEHMQNLSQRQMCSWTSGRGSLSSWA